MGLQTIVVVERTRHLWNKTTHETHFYLSSLRQDDPRIGSAIRQHCGCATVGFPDHVGAPSRGIENSLHWTLDVTFSEDACRVRSLNGTHNLALLRRFALNTLNHDSTSKLSIRQKSRRAAMNDSYMLTLLSAALPDYLIKPELACQ